MKIRAHLTYANVMATIAVFCVLGGGGAYAVGKIGTKQIEAKAVTAPKIALGAVGSRQLNVDADGVALAGVNSDSDGTVLGTFDRLSDTSPSVTRVSPGVYDIAIPGLGKLDPGNYVQSAVITENTAIVNPGQAVVRWENCSGTCAAHPQVNTRNIAGELADRSFNYLLFGATRRGR